MLNRVIVMGRLGRNPELNHTQTGIKVARFSLAVDRDFKDKTTGERATDWLDVVAWRQTAEFVAQYLTKGRMVVVEGRLQTNSYTDREGIKRKAVEIVADSIYFADSKASRPSDGGNAPEGSLPPGGQTEFEDADDDGQLPF